MDRKTNLRNITPSMSEGKNPTEWKGITGEAAKDSLIGKNTLKPHTVAAPPKGNLGGRNTNS
jgi:hypothetical protein